MEVTEVQYKESEIGVIPVDWEVKQLSTIGKFTKGQGIRKDEATNGEIPCVRYGELYTRHNDYIKEYFSFISNETAKSARRLRPGDILFAGSGETKEEIGKCAAFVDNIEAYAGGDIVILSPIDVSPLFLGYLLNAQHIQKQKASKGQGDAIVHISANQLGSIQIPLPPTKSEQTAIATALSDTDALIENLEKLIAKKRNIKQGVMQELLKPESNWILTSVGEVATIRKGEQLNKDTLTAQGQYPVMNGGIQPSGYTDKWNQNPNTIIISEGGNSCGYVNFIKTRFWQGGHCYSVDAKIHKHFLYHLLKFHEKEIMGLRVGSGLPNIQRNRLIEFSLSIPDREKQHAIALVLDEINEVITAMENKLQKYKMVKQGMMQALLTGKIRLA